MSEMEQILEQIKLLRRDFDARLGKIESRLSNNQKRIGRTEKTLNLHQHKILELKKRLDRLDPIWESFQDRRYALDRNEVYCEAEKCGLSASQALQALDREGLLYKNADGRRTAAVKLNNRTIRAVVLFGDEWV